MLRAKGYQVDRVAAYAPRPVAVPPPVAADLRAGAFDAVLLTSPSQAAVIVGLNPAAGVLMVAIGATTAAGAAATGLRVAAVADDPTPAGLVAGCAGQSQPSPTFRRYSTARPDPASSADTARSVPVQK